MSTLYPPRKLVDTKTKKQRDENNYFKFLRETGM